MHILQSKNKYKYTLRNKFVTFKRVMPFWIYFPLVNLKENISDEIQNSK